MRIQNILAAPQSRAGQILSVFLVLLLASFLLPLSAWSGTGNETTAEAGSTPQPGPVVHYILMTGIIGDDGFPEITKDSFNDDDVLALATERNIESIESVHRGKIAVGDGGGFAISTESRGKTVHFTGTVVQIADADPPRVPQYRVEIEVGLDDRLVSAPLLVVMEGNPAQLASDLDGRRVLLAFLISPAR